MLWNVFYHKFQNEYIKDIKDVAVVYVISQFKNKGPFKIGITKYDLYRRMSAYQTAFVNFDIQFLILMSFKKEAILEKLLHNDIELKKYRIKFPPKHPNQRISYSEWFGENSKGEMIKIKTIEYAFRRAFKQNKNITSIFGYDLTHNNKIIKMPEYFTDKGDSQFGFYITKSGTIHKLSKKGHNQYNQRYFDNSRLWVGIDNSMN